MNRRPLAMLILLLACRPAGPATEATPRDAAGAHDRATAEEMAIRRLISDHYVRAVFEARDEASVRTGFHPEFQLFVLQEGELLAVSLEAWLDRLGLDGVAERADVRHRVVFVDVAGSAGVARTELFVDGEHEYTDFFSLYRFPAEGWRIVSKIFESR